MHCYYNRTALQEAYDAAGHDETVQVQIKELNENININLNKSVYLESGYVCDYSINDGNTTINGNVTIIDGIITIQSGTLEVN